MTREIFECPRLCGLFNFLYFIYHLHFTSTYLPLLLITCPYHSSLPSLIVNSNCLTPHLLIMYHNILWWHALGTIFILTQEAGALVSEPCSIIDLMQTSYISALLFERILLRSLLYLDVNRLLLELVLYILYLTL